MHALWSILRKISKIGATRCQILRLKCTKFGVIRFPLGTAPDTAGEHTALRCPRLLSVFKEPIYILLRRGRTGGGRGEGGKERKGRTREKCEAYRARNYII